MDKVSYFKSALAAKAYRHKEWVIGLFTVIIDGLPVSNNANLTLDNNTDNLLDEDYPYRLYSNTSDPGRFYFLDPVNNKLEVIEDSNRDEPLFSVNNVIELEAGTLENLKQTIRTWVGNAVLNAIILVEPFGNKIDYINDRLDEKIDDIVASKMSKERVKEGMVRDPNLIYVDELLKYHESLGMVEGFAQICVPSITEKSILPSKKVIALRDELQRQYADQLNDPAIVAEIMRQIAALDKQELAGDPSLGFYIKDKAWMVTRMKALYFYGIENGFGDATTEAKTILTSIDEGIDLALMPAFVDSIRSASNSRGNLTALGGAKVKYLGRIFQNSRIIVDDCGTKYGLPYQVRADNIKLLTDRYMIDNKGETIQLTSAFLKANIGSFLIVRSAQFCDAEEPSYCAKCLDSHIAIRPNGLYLIPMDVSSRLMNDAMKAMHGKALTTIPFNADIAFGL